MQFDQLKRRAFITMIGGAAAWPLAARAQQAAMPVVGFLNGASAEGYAFATAAFRRGLSAVGYVEGRNVAIEYRWAENQYDRLPALAADLVLRQVAVIVANTPAAPLAKAATTTIPIVFLTSADPVETGLVASLNRPGGNLTGVSMLNVELGPKRLELLHELVPSATTFALLVNPKHPAADQLSRDLQTAARLLGLQLHVLHASTDGDFDLAFAALRQLRAGGLVIGPDPFFISRSDRLGALALQHAVPAIFEYRMFAAAGGLMSYGGTLDEPFHQVGDYTGRILKGDKPADLPVQQSTKIELFINMKAAKALGIAIPLPLSGRADEIIE
jgi:putative tryptophan/tyrosine transport system substrate-binding protein